ncbi:unnamed protein product [Ambrosiozyma monospora]|uniref:Unnamed protein product n=1 Tax=Ambrosiozyma monospora TaxID=43982 RepID=A0ACB5U7U9_AMBMO|nr:unnamed protein product [Ambrosiozyma monospora]
MATRRLDPLDHIILEESYLERTNLRVEVLEKYGKLLTGCHESAVESVRESYDYIFNYLLQRYPKYFYTVKNEKGETVFYNSIRIESFPLNSTNLKPEEMLYGIARNIEEDFLILLKNPKYDEIDEYHLRANVSCFPAGFNPSEKLNTPLTSIHVPVPEYKEKLQRSMNRWFDRLQPYEYMVRNNWGFQIGNQLCDPDGYQATYDELIAIKAADPKDLNFNEVFLRVEKQMFTKLPKSGGVLFLSRYYTYPLTQIRSEGEKCEELCGAIDGLPHKLGLYKRKVYWGDAVKAYLRGESNGSTDDVYEVKMVA